MWIKIRDFLAKPEGEVAKSFLQSQGVTARLSADDVGGLEPQLAVISGVSLFVDEKDVESAEELLDSGTQQPA